MQEVMEILIMSLAHCSIPDLAVFHLCYNTKNNHYVCEILPVPEEFLPFQQWLPKKTQSYCERQKICHPEIKK